MVVVRFFVTALLVYLFIAGVNLFYAGGFRCRMISLLYLTGVCLCGFVLVTGII